MIARLKQIINRLHCKLSGHKRGKRFTLDGDTDQSPKRFRCPRCLATWTRKVKAP